jgi:hypothetical protein
MCALARVVLATGMLLSVAPARAQTYDPNYPICIQTYGRDGNSAQPNASLNRISRVQVPTEPGASAPTDLTRQTASIALTAQSGRHPHH